MQVYIDLYVLINFSMDFLCFFITSKILQGPVRFWRMTLASVIGGIYAGVALFLPISGATAIAADLLACAGNMEDRFSDRETAFAIHRVLHALDEPYKEVFSLRAFGELSFKQIAELFGRTETWARVTYHRARLKIKEELK